MDKERKILVFEFVPRNPHRINHEKSLAYVEEHPDAYLKLIYLFLFSARGLFLTDVTHYELQNFSYNIERASLSFKIYASEIFSDDSQTNQLDSSEKQDSGH